MSDINDIKAFNKTLTPATSSSSSCVRIMYTPYTPYLSYHADYPSDSIYTSERIDQQHHIVQQLGQIPKHSRYAYDTPSKLLLSDQNNDNMEKSDNHSTGTLNRNDDGTGSMNDMDDHMNTVKLYAPASLSTSATPTALWALQRLITYAKTNRLTRKQPQTQTQQLSTTTHAHTQATRQTPLLPMTMNTALLTQSTHPMIHSSSGNINTPRYASTSGTPYHTSAAASASISSVSHHSQQQHSRPIATQHQHHQISSLHRNKADTDLAVNRLHAMRSPSHANKDASVIDGNVSKRAKLSSATTGHSQSHSQPHHHTAQHAREHISLSTPSASVSSSSSGVSTTKSQPQSESESQSHSSDPLFALTQAALQNLSPTKSKG